MPALACAVETPAGHVPEQDIEITAGDDATIIFEFRWGNTGRLRDWTGWTFSSLLKDSLGGTIMATGTVTHNGTGGQLQLVYPSSDTALLTDGDSGVYDIEGVDSGTAVHTVLRGTAIYKGSVT